VAQADYLHNSRMGGTLSIRITHNESVKFYGSTGVVTDIAAPYVSIGVAYQYMWGSGL
jgi:hypothetical protein